MELAVALSSKLSWPFSKMATFLLPSPGWGVALNNSPATAAHCVHCSVSLVYFSVEASGIDSNHHVSTGLGYPFHAMNQGVR